jgi:hypothetical protein
MIELVQVATTQPKNDGYEELRLLENEKLGEKGSVFDRQENLGY